jgi:hypothetical protein
MVIIGIYLGTMAVLGSYLWSQMSAHPLEDDTGALALVKFIFFAIAIAIVLLGGGIVIPHLRFWLKKRGKPR